MSKTKQCRYRLQLILLIAVTFAAAVNGQQPKPLDLPSQERWQWHIEHNLKRYWMQPAAYGEPIGNFPTFRCYDGQLPDLENLCEALDQAWIKPELDRQYTRMISRQTYTYGVIYHLTGDVEALRLAKAGVDYLIANHRDLQNGGFVSYLEQGKPGLEWQQRSTQDQAYALTGLAFYYYLTRDPIVEKVLIESQAFIFDKYRNQAKNELYWVIQDSDGNSAKQQELVAQLDQINAYMLLLTPILPEPHKAKWTKDLQWLTEVLLSQYHNKEDMRFWGGIHHPAAKASFGRHNDFGHTIKGYWMVYLAADLLNRPDWMALAEQGMRLTFERAKSPFAIKTIPHKPSRDYLAGIYGEDGNYIVWRGDDNSMYASWWQWAELDQAALTLSFSDPTMMYQYLTHTLSAFMYMRMDPQYGEERFAKQHHWKNGYHTLEHALVAYIGLQQFTQQPAELYFALPNHFSGRVAPYFFQAEKVTADVLPKTDVSANLNLQRYSFGKISATQTAQ